MDHPLRQRTVVPSGPTISTAHTADVDAVVGGEMATSWKTTDGTALDVARNSRSHRCRLETVTWLRLANSLRLRPLLSQRSAMRRRCSGLR